MAARIAPPRVGAVSARLLAGAEGRLHGSRRRHLQPPQRTPEGLHRPPSRADRRHLDGDGRGDDQRARQDAHRAHDRKDRLQRRLEGVRLLPPRARTGRFLRRLFSTRTLAAVIFRWRLPASAAIVLGAILFIPSADITHIDNDITAWFSKEDPVYRDYERFRKEFGGTRTLIVALKADSSERLFSRPTLEFIQQIASDIERVETVQRVDSLANATLVRSLPRTSAEDDGGLDVRPLLENLATEKPEDIRDLALRD